MSRLDSPTRLALLLPVALVAVLPGSIACGSATPAERAPGPPTDIVVVPGRPSRAPSAAPAWQAKTYRNEEHRLSLRYPADLVEQPVRPGVLFSAATDAQAPRGESSLPPGLPEVVLLSQPTTPGATIEAVAAGVEATLGAISGSAAKVTAKKVTTLRDGVTPAMEMTVDWAFQGSPLQSVVLAAAREDTTVMVTVTGRHGVDLARLSDIANTLTFDP